MKTEVVDLKKREDLLPQYVEMRSAHAALLLSAPVDLAGTKKWLESAGIVIRGLAEDNVLLGAVILYAAKKGEVTFLARETNRGIGSQLLDLVDEMAREAGLKKVWAWVLLENTIAQRVFEKKGYLKLGTFEREYQGTVKKGIRYERNFENGH
jgi:ribosomal protein S18 acetylase RimI-like enzyme